MEKNKLLEKINDSYEQLKRDNPTQILVGILNEIKKNKDLLEYYFSDIDWTQADKDIVYDYIFKDDLDNEQNIDSTERKR